MTATVYTISDNIPINLKEVKGITLLVTVPAAFSGTCTNICVPAISDNAARIKEAGADLILIVSEDQPHAIKKWVEHARWNIEKIAFASDFGKFEVKGLVGKLSDEDGKKDLPPTLGELLRRSYSILKDGNVVWQFKEPDSGKYTLDMETLIKELEKVKGK
jgi:peroxiredoxin